MKLMLIGCERSSSRRPRNARFIPGQGYETKRVMGYDDRYILADVDDFKDNQARVIKVHPNKIQDFKSLYEIETIEQYGNIDRYGTAGLENQPLVIICKIGDIGCRCIDVNGKILNLRNTDLLRYANAYGVANAKVFNKVNSDHVIINGIGWTIPVMSIDKFNTMSRNSNYNAKPSDKLKSYVSKSKIFGFDMFEIDEKADTLIGLKGEYKYSDYHHDILKLPPVKYIGAKALESIHANKIIIPDTVKKIGKAAFEYCVANEIVMPDSIISIGDSAFEDCEVKVIAIPDSVINVGKKALAFRFNDMKILYIGKNITNLEEAVGYWGGRGLEEIVVSPDNPKYFSSDGILYSRGTMGIYLELVPRFNKKAVVKDKDGKTLFKIPFFVTAINPLVCNYMYGYLNIKSVQYYKIADSVKEIPEYAFFNNLEARIIMLGKNTTKIGDGAFSECGKDLEVYGYDIKEISDNTLERFKGKFYVNDASKIKINESEETKRRRRQYEEFEETLSKYTNN